MAFGLVAVLSAADAASERAARTKLAALVKATVTITAINKWLRALRSTV